MKYKKGMILLVLLIFIFTVASVCASDVNDTVIASEDNSTVELSQADTDEIISTDENELISQTDNELIHEGNSGTFAELQANITAATEGSTLILNKNYKCEDGFDSEGIIIDKSITIDGNGFIIDAQGKSRIFKTSVENVVLKNIIFTNGKRLDNGGAVFFNKYGEVTNCTFTNNQATYGGAVDFDQYALDGKVTNCTFTYNSANYQGGAVYFFNKGVVANCTFTNNSASEYVGGAVFFSGTGTVANCTFTNNSASDYMGGAVFFDADGTVTNCNFTDNNANAGSAIYFNNPSATKIVSNSLFLNNRANAESLEVIKNDNNITITFTGNDNLLNAIYSEDDGEVTFTNVTYWSANGISNTGSSPITPPRSNRVAGQNITVAVVVNNKIILNDVKVTDENGMIVLDISVGDNYYITARHDTDSYYTEAEQTISNNTKFNVNVTSQTTTNKTVNITAKSNIFSEVMPGKLIFILSNGDEINATYAGNGTWWATYTFEDCDEYNVSASYVGLDNVTVNDGTITINKVDSTITLDNITLNYGKSKNVTVTTSGAVGITAKINGTNVTVIDNYTIAISGLGAGNYTLTVTTIPDKDHNPVTATSKITVKKVKSTLTVDNIEFDYNDEGSCDVSFTGATKVIANVINQSSAVVSVNGEKITVSGLAAGTYTLNVTTVPDENHTSVTETATITVNKINSTLSVNNVQLDYGVSINLTVTTEGATGITAKIDGVKVTVNDYTIPISGLGAGNHTLTVKTIADNNHTAVTETVNITVNKLSTEITLANETLDLKVNDEFTVLADLTPAGAGNLTYSSSNESVVKISEDGLITALAEGTSTVTVSFAGNDNYTAAQNKTITVTVTLKDASVSADDITLDVGANATVDVTVVPEGLDVTYVPDNSGVVTVENGVVTAVKGGTAKITLTVGGDGVYALNSTTITVTVNKIDTSIDVDQGSLDLEVGDNSSISATLTPADAGNVTFTSSDNKVVTVDNNGKVKAVGGGKANITVSFAGDDKYGAAENKTVTVNVVLIDPVINVSNTDVDLFVGDTFDLIVTTVPEGLSVNYDSSDVAVARVSGLGVITAVGNGSANITLTVGDGKSYTVKSINVTVNVTKIPTKFADVVVEGNNVSLILKDAYGNAIPNANISYTINGVSNTTVSDDNGSFVIVGEPGALIDVDYGGSDVYVPSNISVKLAPVVVRQSSVIVGNNFTQYAVDYNAGERGQNFTVQLKDVNGNVLANKTVLIGYNGKTLERTTNATGHASVQINLRDKNRLTFAVTFLGDKDYNATMSVYLITINQKPVTISAAAKTYKASAKTKKYTVTLKTIKGSSADGKTYFGAGKKVTMKINGKTYTAKTNAKGQATFSLKITKKGKFTATVKYAGDNTYKSASKNVKITIK